MSLYRINNVRPGQDRTACRWCNRHCRVTLHWKDRDYYRTESLATCKAGMAHDQQQYGIDAATLRRSKVA